MRDTLKALRHAKKGQITAGTILLTFIVLLIGLALFGPVQDFANVANASATSTAVQTIIQLIPLFYVLLILAVAALPVVLAFKKT